MITAITTLVSKLGKISWLKVFGVAVPVLLTIWLLAFVYHKGELAGKADVQAKWDTAQGLYDNAIDKARDDAKAKEDEHRKANESIRNDLNKANLTHEKYVAGLNAGFTERLRQSDSRANRYQSLAEGGATERGSLASHAAELDRSLEEGRRLVQEFGSTVELRDAQLKLLGAQIEADRKLLEVQ